MNLDGIPDNIPRERLVALLTELGLDPHCITRDGVHIGYSRIQCEVFAVDSEGKRYAENDTIVRHSVAIEITDDD